MGLDGLINFIRRISGKKERLHAPVVPLPVAAVFGLILMIGYIVMMINIIRSIGVKTLISLFIKIPALEK